MHLSDVARNQAEVPAIVMAGSGRTLSYAELDAASRHLAHGLDVRGLRAGDTVAILMENSVEFIVAALAAQRRGLYFVPVNWHLTAAEIRYMVTDSGASALLTSPALAGMAAAAAAEAPALAHRLILAGAHHGPAEGFDTVRLDTTPVTGPPGDEPSGISMFYSSGTTGRPKGIKPPLPGTSFGADLSLELILRGAYGFDTTTRYLSPGPLYHAAPLGFTLGTIGLGGTAVVMERFDAAETLAAIESHRVTHGQFVPTMFVRMLKLPADVRKAYDLSSLRVAIHAAAPCPVEVKQQVLDWLGPVVYEYYAASEGVCFFAISPGEWLARPGSVGRALAGVPHILDDDGAELPPGEVGQIWIDTPAVFEYHDDPVKTASIINDRGWRTIGDMGALDADGYLYLADRRTDLIISGGVNIYPREIEEAMVMHPDVADVAVIGIPDDEMGQRVMAVVQLRDPLTEGTDGDEIRRSLLDYLASRLARFKLPREIEFVPELPRLPSGKILRRAVRAQYGQAERS